MVDALQEWSIKNPDNKIELIVAGDGPEKDKFKTLQANNIDLKLLGNIPYIDLKNLYNQVDLYLFPTLADEWGVVVNEALASGVPVIGSVYSQAVEEVIEDGKNGWLFHPDSKTEFAETLNKVLSSSDETLQVMSQYCVDSIKNYTPNIVAKTIKDAIEYTLQKSLKG